MLVFNRKYKILLVLILSLFLSFFPKTVHADEIGQLTIKMQDVNTNKKVGGGTLTYYKIANAEINDHHITYQYVPELENETLALSFNITSSKAKEYQAIIKKHNLTGTTMTIPDDGVVTMDSIPAGLYLIEQQEHAAGYEAIAPFCIALPYEQDHQLVYHVTSFPKLNKPETQQPVKITVPTQTSKQSRLPQTGMLLWPIPVLVIMGVVLFVMGYMSRDENE